MRTIFALSGWAKSGKDTMAEVLMNEFGAQRISFAEPLKENVVEDFSAITKEDTINQALKERPIKSMPVDPRDAFSRVVCEFMVREFRTAAGERPKNFMYVSYQGSSDRMFYGTLDGQTHEKLYWTPRALMILEGSTKRSADPDYWVKQAVQKAGSNGLFVISDLRYKSELSGLKMTLNDGDKLVTVRVNRFDTTESTDPSERDLDDATFDYVIENKGTLSEYMSKVNQIITKELK
jgi:hypothetical protein